ncbi:MULTISPECIES: methyltransferase domain-containing protein [unclassified Streptomyces]|uniref:methyltransferase domain-containing protein n=1 Tax=unclassified Streptomyces TaxID=2593676 RepID=UPI002E0F091F|nr:methyltransferase domain-containing protein [Streptomyces sp. NBC_01197]WSS49698.1 methyltransferase domain-containing protein [Streptomyces sp. NBC_01180]
MTGLLRFDGARATEADTEAHTADMVAQRRHLRGQLDVRAGHQVLDVGCGPGYLISELRPDIGPTGRICGIDISDSMLELARERCATGSAPGVVDLRSGRAERIPFPDATFDAAVAVQVYEYVEDIERALNELFRVLRPGGRAVVLDTDWDSLVWRSADRGRMREVLELWEDHVAHPRLPQQLGPLLRRAGFEEEPLTTLTFVDRELDPGRYSYWQVGFIEAFLAGHPGARAEQTRAWSGELRELAATGEYFFSLGRYAFTLRKPAGN